MDVKVGNKTHEGLYHFEIFMFVKGRLTGYINRLGLFLHSIKLFLKYELIISLEEKILSGALFIM
jgi:hypothetical protein